MKAKSAASLVMLIFTPGLFDLPNVSLRVLNTLDSPVPSNTETLKKPQPSQSKTSKRVKIDATDHKMNG